MNEAYMYQHRFASNMGGYGRFAHGIFQGPASAQYKQFHEMKAEMPSDVLQLFKANEVGFIKAPVKSKCRSLDPVLTMGINLMEMFQIPNLQLMQDQKAQTREQRIQRIAEQKRSLNANRIHHQIKQWNPFEDNKIQSDPQKTLLVARLNYETTQKTLKYEFEKYGIIKKVTIVKDSNDKSMGYGFIEFDSKDDFITAYKQANNRKIDGRRVLVDYERGRIVLTWRPRRFNGGLGDARLTKQQLQKLRQQQKEKRVDQKQRKQKKQKQKQRQKQKQKQRERQREDFERKSRSRSAGRKQRKRQPIDQRDNRDRKRYSREKDRKDKKQKERQRDGGRDSGRDRERERKDYNNINNGAKRER